MMLRDNTVRSLKPLVNDPHDYKALLDYVEDRADTLHEQLANAKSWEEVKELQGRLREVQRMTTLRAEVNSERS